MSFYHRTVLEEDENRAVFHSFPDPQQRHFKTQRCAKRTNFVRGNFYNNRKTAFPQDTFAQAINRVFQNFLFLPKEGIFIKGKVEGPFSGNLFTKIIILLCVILPNGIFINVGYGYVSNGSQFHFFCAVCLRDNRGFI